MAAIGQARTLSAFCAFSVSRAGHPRQGGAQSSAYPSRARPWSVSFTSRLSRRVLRVPRPTLRTGRGGRRALPSAINPRARPSSRRRCPRRGFHIPAHRVCRARGSVPGGRAFRSASPHHCSHADATARRRKILPPNATRPRLPATRPPITVTCGPRRISPTMRSQPDKLSRKHSPRDSLPGEVELCTDDFVRMAADFAAEWGESPDNPVRMPQYRMIGVPSGVQL